ncbi:RING-H2 finger protein ATL13-like [Trifolium pratense]|uniref:RING-type E3 ubiquitin transferase n=1 Tax=Trifolium pratense TaxID=57577 RepID=A0A2K3NH88_TRIPR|nr:RING-H2 finger protein ATL13-like [Trifolium pratense]
MGRTSFVPFQGDNTFMPPLAQPPNSFHFDSNLIPPFSPIIVSSLRSDDFGFNDSGTLKVSPSIILIIIILAIVFFISGLLHLLVRFLYRPESRNPDELDDVTVLQGQLQQLFHLHDSGVDQSFIDTLPVFLYKTIIGLKVNPFDCAVCLCEFELEDKLRLLPKCSHAFHMECIDTWLLSHSTCPLCRANLLHDFNTSNNRSPLVLVLESGSDSSREIDQEREAEIATASVVGRTGSVMSTNSYLGTVHGDGEFGNDSALVENIPDPNAEVGSDGVQKVVTVKLGKYRNVDGGGEGSSSNNVDDRRCFSMGSFAYILDETSSLQVPIRTPMKQQLNKKKKKKNVLPLIPGHKQAMSECDCESRRDFKFTSFDSVRTEDAVVKGNTSEPAAIDNRSRKESFSISKIWLRGKKDKRNGDVADSSRRAFSFRFPLQSNVGEDLKGKNGRFHTRSTVSEMDFGKWENGVASEFSGYDEENQSCYSMDSSQPRAPSFARRTLLWLTGRQNKVVHSSSASTTL